MVPKTVDQEHWTVARKLQYRMPNIIVSATRTVKGATKQQWQALIGRDEREGRGCRGGVRVIEREGGGEGGCVF